MTVVSVVFQSSQKPKKLKRLRKQNTVSAGWSYGIASAPKTRKKRKRNYIRRNKK
tara:strand:- start:194 stop:358 length:165 start_codon:yes stop_codon:yes gene_type:complete